MCHFPNAPHCWVVQREFTWGNSLSWEFCAEFLGSPQRIRYVFRLKPTLNTSSLARSPSIIVPFYPFLTEGSPAKLTTENKWENIGYPYSKPSTGGPSWCTPEFGLRLAEERAPIDFDRIDGEKLVEKSLFKLRILGPVRDRELRSYATTQKEAPSKKDTNIFVIRTNQTPKKNTSSFRRRFGGAQERTGLNVPFPRKVGFKPCRATYGCGLTCPPVDYNHEQTHTHTQTYHVHHALSHL